MRSVIGCAVLVIAPLLTTTSVAAPKPTLRNAAVALKNEQYDQAQKLFTEIAHREANPIAQYTLGLLAENGWADTKPDFFRACRWYEQAAFKDHAKAMEKLGHCLKSGIITVRDRKKTSSQTTTPAENYHTPAYWYRKAADGGVTEALCHLGELHRQGQGVEVSTLRALQLCFQAARAGSAWAQRVVGQHFAQQSHFDFAQAAYWYQQSAVNGDGQAAYALAELYFSNPTIVAERFQLASGTHEDLARDWYEVAAGLGIKSAYAKTGILYYRALNTALNQPKKQSGAPTNLLAKTYIWLRASHAAHTPKTPHLKTSAQDRKISANMQLKLKKILPLIPKNWMPSLEAKVVAHFEKYPVTWPSTNSPQGTTPAQIARHTGRASR